MYLQKQRKQNAYLLWLVVCYLVFHTRYSIPKTQSNYLKYVIKYFYVSNVKLHTYLKLFSVETRGGYSTYTTHESYFWQNQFETSKIATAIYAIYSVERIWRNNEINYSSRYNLDDFEMKTIVDFYSKIENTNL